jgi:outer membrane protein assembly factor BamB
VRWTIPWKTNFGENSPDPLIISDSQAGDKIFLSTGHGLGSSLYTLPATGSPTELWNNQELGNHLSSSVWSAGYFYGFNGRVNKKDGHLGCLDAATGKQVWTTPIRGSLIMADKRLIILTLTGELIIAEATPTTYKELARAQVMGGTAWTTPVLSHGNIYVRNDKGMVICLDVGNN